MILRDRFLILTIALAWLWLALAAARYQRRMLDLSDFQEVIDGLL